MDFDRGDLGANADILFERVASLPFDGRLNLLDVGVRAGVSSKLMLDANTKASVTGIDINECPGHLRDHPRYTFIQSDSVTALARITETVHAAFLDTLHIKEQVMAELYFLWPHLAPGGFIAFHDTCWPVWKHDTYFDTTWERPEEAIAALFPEPLKNVSIQVYPESWGMTFVTKLNACELPPIDWTAVFAARNVLLALVPNGVPAEPIVR